MFVILLNSIASASNHTKGMSLRNQKCVIQSILMNLYSNSIVKNYQFAVNLDRCAGSRNTLDNLSS